MLQVRLAQLFRLPAVPVLLESKCVQEFLLGALILVLLTLKRFQKFPLFTVFLRLPAAFPFPFLRLPFLFLLIAGDLVERLLLLPNRFAHFLLAMLGRLLDFAGFPAFLSGFMVPFVGQHFLLPLHRLLALLASPLLLLVLPGLLALAGQGLALRRLLLFLPALLVLQLLLVLANRGLLAFHRLLLFALALLVLCLLALTFLVLRSLTFHRLLLFALALLVLCLLALPFLVLRPLTLRRLLLLALALLFLGLLMV